MNDEMFSRNEGLVVVKGDIVNMSMVIGASHEKNRNERRRDGDCEALGQRTEGMKDSLGLGAEDQRKGRRNVRRASGRREKSAES